MNKSSLVLLHPRFRGVFTEWIRQSYLISTFHYNPLRNSNRIPEPSHRLCFSSHFEIRQNNKGKKTLGEIRGNEFKT